jgi:hypothetical protein
MTLTGDTGSVSGTLNTWQVLSSTRAWSIGTVAAGVKIVTGTLEIRRKIGQNVVASSAVGMSAARV